MYASDLEEGSYEWVMEQTKMDSLMKNQNGHSERQRADIQSREREGDGMLRLLRMKISVNDVGDMCRVVRVVRLCFC